MTHSYLPAPLLQSFQYSTVRDGYSRFLRKVILINGGMLQLRFEQTMPNLIY